MLAASGGSATAARTRGAGEDAATTTANLVPHVYPPAIAYTKANELAETAAAAANGADGAGGAVVAKPGLSGLRVEVIGCAGIQSRMPNAQPSAYVAYAFHELKVCGGGCGGVYAFNVCVSEERERGGRGLLNKSK